MSASPKHSLSRVYVWDLPTRLFHWSLFICVTCAYICVKLGGLWMDWHVRFGLATLALIIFRIIWGFTGSRYARFSAFVRGPKAIWGYVRRRGANLVGHNPLGALSVIALLLVLGVQVFSGLFANDEIMTNGPLAYINSTWSTYMTAIHVSMEWVIIALVALHILANLFYTLVLRKDLIKAMIVGHQATHFPSNSADASDNWKVRLWAFLLIVVTASFVYWLTTLAPSMDYSFM